MISPIVPDVEKALQTAGSDLLRMKDLMHRNKNLMKARRLNDELNGYPQQYGEEGYVDESQRSVEWSTINNALRDEHEDNFEALAGLIDNLMVALSHLEESKFQDIYRILREK